MILRVVRLGLILGLLGIMSACASGPTVYSDFDAKADFANYRTFGFFEPLGTDTAGYSTLVTERLKSATQLQMEQKGYVYDAKSPDLLVNFQLQVQTRTAYVPPPPMPWGPNYYGYRMGWYGPWPGYDFEPQMVQYAEGAVNIDLIDARKKQMVWEGVATQVLDNETQARTAAYIDPLVADIFSKYPFLAGSDLMRQK
ncbi:DUF4136 domain-containing protein [Orrella sp. 11846]|uniref:DUF4136 domain-containing protein n=1 Tax=Orrella sp. 11846 TaxID=3409913 RepID=UPI003B5941D3